MTPYIKSVCDRVLEEWKEHPASKKLAEVESIYSTRSYATPFEGENLPQFMERVLSRELESLLRKAMEGMPPEKEEGTAPEYDMGVQKGWNAYRSEALASLQALGAKEV
jgi:hypothetical protein